MTGDAAAERDIALDIATRSGAVVVWARPIARAEVLHGSAEIQPDGVVRSSGSGRVEIACPEGSDVVIGSSSGRIECHGPLGRVAATGQSGRITIDDASEIDVRTSSGRVVIGQCAGTCRVAVSSGSVKIESAGSIDVTLASGSLVVAAVGDVVVRAGSGRVHLGLLRASSVDVCTVSGRVSVTLPPGVAPQQRFVTRSGRVRSEIEPGLDGSLTIETISGTIKVSRG